MTKHRPNTKDAIPQRAGVGLKACHYDDILDGKPDLGWFEIHAENYMGEGGMPHHVLSQIRNRYPISCHGVGLSIGSARGLDPAHLDRLKKVVQRYEPGLVSEHLAWSTHDRGFLNDLLPVPYTAETAFRVSEHIDQVQTHLGRQILLENPSTYVAFAESEMSEIAFLKEITERTGCGLLLDVNNVYVSATNQGYAPGDYLTEFPVDAVGEIHLGGHANDRDDDGRTLLIDAHDRAIAAQVWKLYEDLIGRIGPRPTLVEWDNDVPAWPVLFTEAQRADAILAKQPAGDGAKSRAA
ncbi:MAG: DUF692 domain-containing protein [Alphaproteobacteria bacterium]|nr:DUF692 domain-containing protein [Alphaproteobacteria bacterium]